MHANDVTDLINAGFVLTEADFLLTEEERMIQQVCGASCTSKSGRISQSG